MKRLLTCALTLMMLLALAAPALADVVWEPYNNRFYDTHWDECTYIGRNYYANGAKGFVTLYDAPDGSIVEAQYQNGFTLCVYWQYNDWGCITVFGDEETINGWVPMADLELVYDCISFEEEYADRITPYDGEFADYDGEPEVINFYSYPGAAGVSQSFDVAKMSQHMGDILGNLTGTADNSSYISSIFVDEDGRTWGFVSYMYGHLDAWFCLDEPDGTDFPVRDVSAPSLTPAQTPTLPASSYVPYILVAAVVVVTVVLLAKFRKKTAGRPGNGLDAKLMPG